MDGDAEEMKRLLASDRSLCNRQDEFVSLLGRMLASHRADRDTNIAMMP